MPALTDLMTRIEQRRVRGRRGRDADTVAVRRVAAVRLRRRVHVRGRRPLAERRAAALSLDTTLLAELLGRVELRELLDPDGRRRHAPPAAAPQPGPARPRRRRRGRPAAAARAADRRRRSPQRRPPTDAGGWLEGLRTARRARDRVVCRPDVVGGRRGHRPAARRRRHRGAARRAGELHREPVADPLASCSAATRAPAGRSPPPMPRPDSGSVCGSPPTCWAGWPSTASWCAANSPLPPRSGDQWCDAEVLRMLRRRSLAALRAQVEPVSTAAYGRFLPAWQQVGATGSSGIDGLRLR